MHCPLRGDVCPDSSIVQCLSQRCKAAIEALRFMDDHYYHCNAKECRLCAVYIEALESVLAIWRG